MMINIGNFNEQKVTLKFILIQITTERERDVILYQWKKNAQDYVLVKKRTVLSARTQTHQYFFYHSFSLEK